METKETITRKEATDLDQTLYLLAKRDLSYKIETSKLPSIGNVTIITLHSTGEKLIFLGNKKPINKGHHKNMVFYILSRTQKALKKANDDLKDCNRIVNEAEAKMQKRPLEIRMLKVLKYFIQEQGVLIAELEEIQDLHERYLSIFKKVEDKE